MELLTLSSANLWWGKPSIQLINIRADLSSLTGCARTERNYENEGSSKAGRPSTQLR